MTMDRRTKTQHATELITAATTGYTTERFASPKLIQAARADRGHTRMTAAEYAALRMDRGQMSECRLETALEMRGVRHRQQRIIGGRRITGRRPGTKKQVNWTDYGVERCIRPKR